MGCAVSAGGGCSGDGLVADEDLENLSASDIYEHCSNTKKSHKKEYCLFHVLTDLSNASILHNHAAKCPPGETLSKMQRKRPLLS